MKELIHQKKGISTDKKLNSNSQKNQGCKIKKYFKTEVF